MPLPFTVTVLVNTWVEHAALLNRWKVIVPVGLNPPLKVAVSLIGLPIVTGVGALVVSPGWAWLTTLDSLASPHAVDTGLLLVSPL